MVVGLRGVSMKFNHKCVCCSRKATVKFRGRHFCDDCAKEVRRSGIDKVWAEQLVFSIGDMGIYRHYQVKLK